ncbi:MAG: hypothetical protein JWP81_2501 [Ferruginibacter sp.]|nr:hypothetical protein [Ferruginibacter sp.]
MKSKAVIVFGFTALIIQGCKEQKIKEGDDIIIGAGQMPDMASDRHGNFSLVYGTGDSIMYSSSSDQGKTFSAPDLIAVLPGLAASHMRGPQIASGINGVSIIAVNNAGNIFSYNNEDSGKWSQAARVNDVDTVAKEQLMDLGADGQNFFAVWLDLRDKHNEIYGAGSSDGGKTWSKNRLIYASPDTTVCECCKPSVVIKGSKVYVMFRNWLHGNRDLYLIESSDSGNTFGEAKKLGNDSWALDGCPMAGGGLAINDKGTPETVWLRKSTIYTCQPGQPETAIGQGRNCTIESVDGKNIYAWTENGEVVILNPQHEKKVLGKGSMPVIKSINNEQVLCIWENENQIHSGIVSF